MWARGRDRNRRKEGEDNARFGKRYHHHMDCSGILLVVLHAGLLGAGGP